MVARSTGTIDERDLVLKTPLVDHVLEHGFGDGRATDVAKADHEDGDAHCCQIGGGEQVIFE